MTFLTDLLFPNFNINTILGAFILILGLILVGYGMFTINTILIYVGLGVVGLGLFMVYGLSFLQDIFDTGYGWLVISGVVFLLILYLVTNKGGKKRK